jgi:mono/diheme cytochrome c family protein
MKTIQKFMIAIVLLTFFLSMTVNAQQATTKAWEVPAKYKTMKASVNLKDAGVIAIGKELWAKHCKSCHGSKGLGDGPKAATLKTHPGDFSSATFQKQTDGDIYYKAIIGRDEMPNYEKKIPSESDRWSLVAFMRTLKK